MRRGNVFGRVCLCVCVSIVSLGMQVHLHNLLVKFVYKDLRVKVKVTGKAMFCLVLHIIWCQARRCGIA